MKAALLMEARAPLSIEDVAIDKPGPAEVLIQVKASGLCHTDYSAMTGAVPCSLPGLLGHEASGIVEAVGDNVRGIKPGDRVTASYTPFCGVCHECMDGHSHRCDDKPSRASTQPALRYKDAPVFQFAGVGGFAEQILVDQSAVVRLPDAMPLDVAALLGCAVLTGVGAALCRAEVKPGQTAIIIGCGGVGLNVIQGARIAGASRIVAIDTNSAKLKQATAMGATDTVISGPDTVAQVMELLKRGADHAFDVVGRAETALQGASLLGKGGKLTLIGISALGTELTLPLLPFIGKEIAVQGSVSGSASAAKMVPLLAQFYLNGQLKLDALISERIALKDVNAGYARMAAGETTRSVILFD